MPVPNITGPSRTEVTTIAGEVSGAAGIATWPTAAAYANNVSLAEVIAYIQDGVRKGTGTAMGANKSVADALGTNGVTVTDAAASVLGAIGADNADNAFASTSVVANRDGSVLERLEHLLDCLIDDETSNALGVDDSNNAFSSTNVASNADGSILERLEYLQQQTAILGAVSQYKFATKTSASPLTTGTLFNYAGSIEIAHIIGRVTTGVQAQATTIKLSITPDALAAYDICSTVDANAFVAGTLLNITGTAANAMVGTDAVGAKAPGQANPVIATCVTSGTITVTYGAASTGAIVWEILWRPLNAAGSVTAA